MELFFFIENFRYYVPQFLFTLILIFFLRRLISFILLYLKRGEIFSKLEKYQQLRKESLLKSPPSTVEIPQILKEKILNSDATTLISMLNEFQVTSLQILKVYYERAVTIGLELEAIAESNIDESLDLASKCDEVRKNIGKNNEELSKLPPLYGIPISIKSLVEFQGKSVNLGCVNFLDHISKEDGFILKLIRKAGAIPFITSNIPQCLMLNETVNRIWGRAKNPWNKSRTPGGSSGGESALIAARCSPIGLGTDIGGSIRIPSLYTGIYGLKVTTNRLTYEGVFCGNESGKKGNINITACNGPMGKSVNDLALFLKGVIVPEMWEIDRTVAPIAWNEQEYNSKRKLRIGYVENDNFFAVSPGNRRAVNEAVKALEKQGHEIVRLCFPNFEKGILSFFGIMSAAGKFRPYSEMMGAEPPVDEYKQLIFLAKLPSWFRTIVGLGLRFLGEKRKLKLLNVASEKSAFEYFLESEKQQEVKKDFHSWWLNNKLDGLISPGLSIPAITHGSSLNLNLTCCYTFFFNLIDYPTGAVPITFVKDNEQTYIDPINHDSYTEKCKENMRDTKGLPLGVQITTLPYKEELCLNIMRQLENEIKFHSYPQI